MEPVFPGTPFLGDKTPGLSLGSPPRSGLEALQCWGAGGTGDRCASDLQDCCGLIPGHFGDEPNSRGECIRMHLGVSGAFTLWWRYWAFPETPRTGSALVRKAAAPQPGQAAL